MLSPLGPGVPISPRLTLAKMAGVVRHQEVAPKDATSFTDDAECVRYIISTNIHRWHLTVNQRADIADELAVSASSLPIDADARRINCRNPAVPWMAPCASSRQRRCAPTVQVGRL